MDVIDRMTLATLASHHVWPSVSIYLPTHRAGADKNQDPIRLRNLIIAAARQLVAEGMRAPEAEAFLEPASQVLTDNEFWRRSGDGLAVFVQAGEAHVYQVDIALPEQYVVGGRFSLRPLALAYRGDESFFALAFDRNGTRLFAGDRTNIRELKIAGAPTTFAAEIQYDQREESLQYTTHASPASIAGAGPAIGMFHGHAGENVDKTELQRFASDLAKAVSRALGPDNTIPLVLIGVDYELAAYRAANTYRGLANEQVLGATDELTARSIHQAALRALGPRFEAAVDSDLAELREKRSALVSTDPAEIVSAAATGRVKTLFFDLSAGPFGRFDRDLLTVTEVCGTVPRYLRETADTVHVSPEDCGWDLVDLAAAETVLHGGVIHAFTGEDAPVPGVAAVLRY